MTARIPVLSTAIVLAAVATMVALGFWQLGRMDEKEALIAQYRAVGEESSPVEFPASSDDETLLFRRSTVRCTEVVGIQPTAGRNSSGQSGWAQRASCLAEGLPGEIAVDIGWTRAPEAVAWKGGVVTGTIAPGPRLIASEPATSEMQPLARPDPGDLPNNHLAYAVQWFFFAITALVIYALVLRQGMRRRSDG